MQIASRSLCISHHSIWLQNVVRWQAISHFLVHFIIRQILQDRLARFYESRTSCDAPEPAPEMGEVTMEVAESLKHHPDPLSEIQSKLPSPAYKAPKSW